MRPPWARIGVWELGWLREGEGCCTERTGETRGSKGKPDSLVAGVWWVFVADCRSSMYCVLEDGIAAPEAAQLF